MKQIVMGILVGLLCFTIAAFAQSGDLKLLQGKWKSVSDPQDVIEFKNDRIISRDSGDVTGNVSFSMVDTCGGLPSDPARYLQTEDDDCYYLVKLSKESLTLNYVGRGNDLRYRRISR